MGSNSYAMGSSIRTIALGLEQRFSTSTPLKNLIPIIFLFICKAPTELLRKFYGELSAFSSQNYCLLPKSGAPLGILKQYIEQKQNSSSISFWWTLWPFHSYLKYCAVRGGALRGRFVE
jgi:hypothetical protein